MKKIPTMLTDKVKPVSAEIKAEYDWKKQRAAYEGCKFGTTSFTNSSTSSCNPGCAGPYRDDSNTDSIGD